MEAGSGVPSGVDTSAPEASSSNEPPSRERGGRLASVVIRPPQDTKANVVNSVRRSRERMGQPFSDTCGRGWQVHQSGRRPGVRIPTTTRPATHPEDATSKPISCERPSSTRATIDLPGYRKDQAHAGPAQDRAREVRTGRRRLQRSDVPVLRARKGTITWYPASDANARRVFDHLVDSGKADRTD
jgi:hypothetical protein